MKVKRLCSFARRNPLGSESVKMGLIAGRDLQGPTFDLQEVLHPEVLANTVAYPVPGQKQGSPVGMNMGGPPG